MRRIQKIRAPLPVGSRAPAIRQAAVIASQPANRVQPQSFAALWCLQSERAPCSRFPSEPDLIPLWSPEAAQEAVAILDEPANAAQLTKVQAECAGDLGKFFMMVIPLASQLVGSVIKKYGFEADQQGAMAFVAELQRYQEDPEIKALKDKLSAKFMPQMPSAPAPPADDDAD